MPTALVVLATVDPALKGGALACRGLWPLNHHDLRSVSSRPAVRHRDLLCIHWDAVLRDEGRASAGGAR